MFNLWKTEKVPVSIDQLAEITEKARGQKKGTWPKEKIEKFYNEEFLPAALSRAKQGFSSVNVYDLFVWLYGFSFSHENYAQVRSFLQEKGYRELQTFRWYW